MINAAPAKWIEARINLSFSTVGMIDVLDELTTGKFMAVLCEP